MSSAAHRFSFNAFVALLVIVLICAVPARAAAQVLYGSVVGDVKDSSGASMPGATVLVTNNNTGFKREAVTDGEDEGLDFHVVSGWRATSYQDELFREAVWKYGSQEEAARWVATAGTSPHVSGDAIDIGPAGAAAWLSAHGAEYGLCQIYRNEPWHFELRPASVDRRCPRMYADPSHDPRMRH